MRTPNPLARRLRKAMPDAEVSLWARLRRKQLGGFRFRRQHSIGPYVADFACLESRLVVELDGEQHAFDEGARDRRRDAFIEAQGFAVIRFWNRDVYEQIDSVLGAILDAAETGVRRVEFEKTHR